MPSTNARGVSTCGVSTSCLLNDACHVSPCWPPRALKEIYMRSSNAECYDVEWREGSDPNHFERENQDELRVSHSLEYSSDETETSNFVSDDAVGSLKSFESLKYH